MTFESKMLWLGGLVLAAVASGCGECDESADSRCFTDGEATLDLSGDLPVFGVTGLSEESKVPNTLTVHRCDGAGSWDVGDIEDPTRVTYGVAPDGAKEDDAAEELEEGGDYVFYFVFENSNPFTSEVALQPDAWSGSFVAGDPDSFVLADYLCEEAQTGAR